MKFIGRHLPDVEKWLKWFVKKCVGWSRWDELSPKLAPSPNSKETSFSTSLPAHTSLHLQQHQQGSREQDRIEWTSSIFGVQNQLLKPHEVLWRQFWPSLGLLAFFGTRVGFGAPGDPHFVISIFSLHINCSKRYIPVTQNPRIAKCQILPKKKLDLAIKVPTGVSNCSKQQQNAKISCGQLWQQIFICS